MDAVILSLKRAEDKLKDTPKQFVHSDMNEHNIIVGEEDELGLIDFNDLILAYRVFELGPLIGYMLTAQQCNLAVSSV